MDLLLFIPRIISEGLRKIGRQRLESNEVNLAFDSLQASVNVRSNSLMGFDNVIVRRYIFSPMRDDRYSGTTLPRSVQKLCRMAEHEADRYCGGCLLRRVSAHAAGLASPAGKTAFDVYASADTVCDRDGRERRMTPGERAVAVRAIAAMTEFARLADSPEGKATAYCEALLIDPKNPRRMQESFLGLLQRHRAEWDEFVGSLPNRSWVREMVRQL